MVRMLASLVSSFLAELELGIFRRRTVGPAVLFAMLSAFAGPFAVLSAFARPAAADEIAPGVRVLLVSSAPEDPLFARIAAELTSQGFEVLTRRLPRQTELSSLAELAARAAAAAVVAVDVVDAMVEVQIVDRVRHQSMTASVGVGGEGEASRAVAALRTVELVRTNLIDLMALTTARSAQRTEPAPQAADLPAPARIPRNSTRFGIGSGASLSPPLDVPAWHALISLRHLLLPAIGIETLVLVPLSSTSVSGSEGSAKLWFAFAALGVDVEPRLWSGATASVGAGAGAVLVRTTGDSNAGYRPRSESGAAFSPYLRLGLAQAVSSSLALRADVTSALALPRTVLVFDERRVADWGRPWLAACVSAEWTSW